MWSTVSTAFCKFTNIPQPKVSASRDSLILPVKLIRAWVVEYFGRKPNCNDYIRLLMSRQLDTWVRWAFSTWVFQWFFQQYALTNDYLGK